MANSNPNPKVLICTITSNHKDYIIDHWIDYVRKFTYKNADILIIDNSVDEKYHEKIIKRGVKCMHIQPEEKESLQSVMAKSNEILRNYCLIEGFDFMMLVEVDIFPPKNVIECLLSHDKPVIAGTYFIFIEKGIRNLPTFIVQQLEPEMFLNLRDKNETHDAFLYDLDEAFLWCDGTVKQVYAAGTGCILINSKVLRQIHFRTGDDGNFADSIFALDLYTLNIPVFVDTSIICQHLNSDWINIKLKYQIDNKILNPKDFKDGQEIYLG